MDIHQVELPSSKSISNRLLIIHALGNLTKPIHQLSVSDDSLNLQNALLNHELKINVGEGGTTLRFVLAYLCLKSQHKIIDGTGHLRSRPLLPLIQVLEQLGCSFQFENNGYELPIEILRGVNKKYTDTVFVDSRISSQFVSSILLIAPYFEQGLKLGWTSGGVSEPYIRMTLKLMHEFGIQILHQDNGVVIKPGSYTDLEYTVEADWSAAAFILAWIALQEKFICFFPRLKKSGLQADEVVIDFFKSFGVTSIANEHGLLVEKIIAQKPDHLEFDFTNCPDLFPAISLFCALQKVNVTFTGLHHLVYKESNRLQIIVDFLSQCRVAVREIQKESAMYFEMASFQFQEDLRLDSHQDHRIAMAFSLLNILTPVHIHNPEVVSKSFPNYWDVFEELRRNSNGIR